MKKSIIIALIILIIPVFVYAQWSVNVTVRAEISKLRDEWALKDSIETVVNVSLDSAEVKFNPSMLDSTWYLQVYITGQKKPETDLDDFAVSIDNYFNNKFTDPAILTEYRKKAQ